MNDNTNDLVNQDQNGGNSTVPPSTTPDHDVQLGGFLFKAEKKMIEGTVEYEMELGFGPAGYEKKPVLLLLPATERTREFYNEEQDLKQKLRKKNTEGNRKRKRAAKNMNMLDILGANQAETVEEIEAYREMDRKLFTKHIVKGWKAGTLLDANGNEIPSTPGAIEAFLRVLIELDYEEFDALCNWARQPENFREDSDLTDQEKEELGNA